MIAVVIILTAAGIHMSTLAQSKQECEDSALGNNLEQ
jgi:hypothetical protein